MVVTYGDVMRWMLSLSYQLLGNGGNCFDAVRDVALLDVVNDARSPLRGASSEKWDASSLAVPAQYSKFTILNPGANAHDLRVNNEQSAAT